MDAGKVTNLLNQINSLAQESARGSETLSARFIQAEELFKRATQKCEQSTEAISSWRVIRYFQLRREERALLAQAAALMEFPKDIAHRNDSLIASAKMLQESLRNLK